MRSFACASFAIVLASLCGCSTPLEQTARHLTGTVVSPEGHTIDQVAAVGTSGAEVFGRVDETGEFDLIVYGGVPGSGAGKLRVVFLEQNTRIGVLRFQDTNGKAITLLGVTDAPPPGLTPKNGPGSGGDGPEVKVTYEKIGISLGTVTLADGDNWYEASKNPLSQVDNDEDGVPDLQDKDDDNDKLLDVKDPDADGDDWDDAEQYNDDYNADGVPDVLQQRSPEEEEEF
jgi:hypothetical protein